MNDLVTWLRAQLDDDEQSIRTWGSACVHIDACDDTGDFMERFEEDRMLADVAAKRRILDVYQADVIEVSRWPGGPREWMHGAEPVEAHTVLRLLALPYADRPGYRDEWRPA